ncbi:FAD-dependent oxidoreductase [Microbacterium caowuchunii]|uniref:FAD-dependent oxidoreductase n=1 Tax=Microbacterium caowuchunii TaxID=2614638 RepID=A0A5N0TKC6_9MICO|nr:FAD-dependent oxidoreductase [Microbacterium caowuchunii]KAA9135540.1 FAD-dependent oxidoreductase [Microbacterium caowuchunii]
MRVAILGAGFFGFHIAHQLERRYPGIEVEIFEKDARPLRGAGTHNQCRLHMGFHYPRSGYTIYQSIMGFDRFVAEYGEFLSDVGDNLYAVRHDGLVSVEAYLAVMDAFHLRYETVPVSPDLFRDPDGIGVVLRVPERSIDVQSVRERLAGRVAARLHTWCRIDEIDAARGMLRSGSQLFGPFDYIVNASYTDPNLGLPENLHFAIKWELTALVLATTSLAPDAAVTIMDGEYVSVYPAYGGMHTLSSVAHTPIRRYTTRDEMIADYPRRLELANRAGAEAAIADDVARHLNVQHDTKELWVTAKTKLATDMGDSRVTEVRRHDRLFSVLCGKIDAVFEASDTILQEMTWPIPPDSPQASVTPDSAMAASLRTP